MRRGKNQQPPAPGTSPINTSGSANHAYYLWVDRFNTLGLGANVPIASTNGGESLMAVVNGKIVDIRVPYPLGFFTKLVDGRIDERLARHAGVATIRHRVVLMAARFRRVGLRGKLHRCRRVAGDGDIIRAAPIGVGVAQDR